MRGSSEAPHRQVSHGSVFGHKAEPWQDVKPEFASRLDPAAAMRWDRLMADYDAFGRKVGDDPLEQTGTGASAVPAAPPDAPARPPSRRFPVVIAAALVVGLASIGVAISMLAVTGEDSVTQTTAAGEAPPVLQAEAEGTAETPPGAVSSPAAAERASGSLLTRPVLQRAITALRSSELGRPMSLRVAESRVDAALIDARGKLSVVQVGPDGEPRVITTTSAGQRAGIPWSAVDPGAPQKLVRAAAEREKRTAADVDYLVLMPLAEPTWGLFFKDGTHYQGDTAGKITRRVSG